MKPVLAVLSLAALLSVCSSGATALAAPSSPTARSSLAGTWSGHYGGAYSGTFTLHWTQSGPRLIGSIALSKPAGTFSITGSVRGNAIKFGAVGAGATYTGTVSGRSMSGNYTTALGGGTWGAHKTS